MQRKIGFAQYKNTTKEILPKTYMIDEITCQRKMFCTMINQYLCKDSKFDLAKESTFKHTLLNIFEEKIISFFQFYRFKPEKTQKITKIYAEDSLLINQYFKQSKHKKMQYLTKNICFNQDFKLLLGYLHPAIDLIQLIFNGKKIEMMLDLNTVFTKTIYNRIKKEKNKHITLNAPYIHITQYGVRTRLYPQWKQINPQNLSQRENDINDGFIQLNNKETDNYYLVYPKTQSFKKHITVVGESSKLKMIPYSFTYCNRLKNKERLCQK